MTIEQFDVVDLNDKPTGSLTTKKIAHENGIPHRVAAVFVFDQDDNLLLQVHEGHNGQLDHTVGGHVSAGEDYITAAKRELEEEIDLVAPINEVQLHVLSDERFPGFNYFHFFGIYEAKPTKDWQFIPNNEVKRLVPMKLVDIIDDMQNNPEKFTRGFINTLDAYIKIKGLAYKLDKKVLLKDRLIP